MEMGYKALREAVAGVDPFNPRGPKQPQMQNHSLEYLNKRMSNYDNDYIGPSKDKSVVPYSMTDTAPPRVGDFLIGREGMNQANQKYFKISGSPNSLGRNNAGLGRTPAGIVKGLKKMREAVTNPLADPNPLRIPIKSRNPNRGLGLVTMRKR